MSQPDALIALHEAVSLGAKRLSATLAEAYGAPLAGGRGCSGCGRDDLTVFELEASLIRGVHAELIESGSPHPPGACAFLDGEGSCRIYAQRPYVCRTQGLPLRWLEPDGEGGGLEYRDICPLNESEGGTPLVELELEHFWTLGPWEQELRRLQELSDGGRGHRVALRALFARSATG